MGRHSKPDPEDAPEEDLEPQTERFGRVTPAGDAPRHPPRHGGDASTGRAEPAPPRRRRADADPYRRRMAEPGYGSEEHIDRPGWAPARRRADHAGDPRAGYSPRYPGDEPAGYRTGPRDRSEWYDFDVDDSRPDRFDTDDDPDLDDSDDAGARWRGPGVTRVETGESPTPRRFGRPADPAGPADIDDDDDEDRFPATAGGGGGSVPPRRPRRGAHSADGNNEWTGSHRAVSGGRRGVSVGVIVALVSVVVVVGAVILWRFVGDVLDDRSEAAAARCVEGDLTVGVVADPSIAEHISSLAESYNAKAAPVGDRCVKIGVTAADADRVVNGFIGTWPTDLGERPALWIPASSISAARLEASAGAQAVSDSRSLVSTPVVLAVRPELKHALGQRTWADLPRLQNEPDTLDGLGLRGWGSLRLALPVRGDADASYLVAEAVAATSAPPGAPATAGLNAINALVAGQPRLADTTAATALDALIDASDPATAEVHAVVTTEQQLYQHAQANSDAKGRLAAWRPAGPAAVADYPAVLLDGNWLSQEQMSAASEFARFLRKGEQLATLAEAGFHAEGAEPPDSDIVDFADIGDRVAVADAAERATLANALTTPVRTGAVTIMLDQSMPTDDGGRSRLANVVDALTARLGALPGNAAVGLWTFDGVEGRSEVPLGELSAPVGGRPRSEVLTEQLRAQDASSGGAVSFTTLRLVYQQATENYVEGQNNSVLVITTGPHTDRTLDGPGLQDFLRGAFDPQRPIAVNVIDFGDDADRPTWEAVAQITGGRYQNLASSAGPELVTAITTLLG
ncbi:bacterial extracellular solute-binding family protein [Mycolicibacterium hassiacum DSM 44199]|jgi:hypothetical protein|uniref:Bacterial extracellular solute-binding family protein n=1 Tax=Mycolicibacterium hassiacum (strain DSM 44199 / CIP 105218 / JCM 12690 / 3849) TaxID=1122247 RepID=K5BBA6_MYCHD|nr:substrate-binding domain-containing protein [Mycolicibacterium hassiacum]EKF23655.1 bacterial extracellular solute-binding family protein [Mycolicibacterium hassiacum DSM 44199]MDA4088565.1 hypothetical protein [Mycolicibacterium hassiacum DSM 44199]VCT90106.1 hypothetical protein MHAS_01810 [Mycolicibacterium hassiacum DSM 44199]